MNSRALCAARSRRFLNNDEMVGRDVLPVPTTEISLNSAVRAKAKTRLKAKDGRVITFLSLCIIIDDLTGLKRVPLRLREGGNCA
jgi:hypothetical protein